MSSVCNPRLLVVMSGTQGYYVDREIYGLIPGFETYLAGTDSRVARRFRGSVRFHAVRFFGQSRIRGDPAGLLSSVRGLDKVIADVAPDVIVTFELYSVTTNQVARTRHRTSYLHVVSSYETTGPSIGLWGAFPLTRLLAVRNSARVDLCLASSIRTLEALHSAGVPLENILLLRPGVFPEDFDAAENPQKASPPAALYVGALRKNKGLVTLVRGLDTIWPKDLATAQLIVGGAGPLASWMQSQSRDRKWLHFIGEVTAREKSRLLRSASVFVYPSEDIRVVGFVRWEEQGALSVVEAMMSGLPIVSTNSGVLSEIVPSGNVIVPQKSPEYLARAIEEMLQDPDACKKTGARNAAYARAQFDVRKKGGLLAEAIRVRQLSRLQISNLSHQ
jgi:glycosyltransferase involved in cell wall biosynthesis